MIGPASAGAGAVVALLVTTAADRARAPDPRTIDPPSAIVAAFPATSYSPGARARLSIRRPPRRLTVQLFRAGGEQRRPPRDDLMLGVAIGRPLEFRWSDVVSRRTIRVAVPRERSGLYFVRLEGSGRVGFAPFVVRPSALGRTARVAVVLPTNTWQAYNFRDDDRDGIGDTWYADPRIDSVGTGRPYMNRGVPPKFRGYDRAFIRWLDRTGKSPDVLSDDDLASIPSGDRLARLYELIVFPGHSEYVSKSVFDRVERFRDLGGNLAFLSANNFFYRVERTGTRLVRLGRWRDAGRPTAPLLGGEYVGWFENRYPNRPYRVVGVTKLPWLFAGTGLRNGESFGRYGIEVDATTPRSPASVQVAARIANIFGRGRSAEMTYYETGNGAKVFSAGVINFGGSAELPIVSRMLENLWARLSRP